MAFEHTTKRNVQANLHDTLEVLKTKMENDLGIPSSKQVLSFHNTVLQDDTLTILSIPGIANGSHIELKIISDDDTVAQWTSTSSSNSSKRFKLMVKDKSIETMANTIDSEK